MTDEGIYEFLRPRLQMHQYKGKENMDLKYKKVNNSLYEGERRQACHISIMIAGRGHLIGYDDIVNGRLSTTTVRCLSNTGILIAID